jgi:hypothetical protein
VGGTGSGSCPVVGFDIRSTIIESVGSSTSISGSEIFI